VPTVAEVFALALQQHRAGDLHQAEQLYRIILQADPGHADTHHSLGVLAYGLGHYGQAVVSIRQAISLNPAVAVYHYNLGSAQARLGQVQEAVASYQKALSLQPCFAEASNNLGTTLLDQGQLEEAVQHFRQALRMRPGYFEAHLNLGGALLIQSKPAEAEAQCRQALRIAPDSAEAHNNLGRALQEQGKLEAAVDCFHQALQLKPNSAEMHRNLGNAVRELGKLEEALTWFQRALRLKPDFPVAHNDLGYVLAQQGRLDLAVASFQEALRLQPDLAAAQSNSLVCLNYDPEADPDAVFAEHRRWGQAQESGVRNQGSGIRNQGSGIRGQESGVRNQESGISQQRLTPDTRLLTPEYDPERRLRVGYVSSDLRYHALTHYFEPVLAHHDPVRVEAFCYAEVAHPDAVTTRLQNLAQGWRWTCGLTDAQVAQRIRDDRIDILVDLAGHMSNNRLRVFALKPAPVQATWLGYLNTTGLSGVDYRLTDEVLDPPGEPVRDTEELLRLPGGMCCFAPPADAPAVAPLPAHARGHLTFGSLHSLFKFNARVFNLWSEVLKALPRARLLIFRDTLTSTAQEHFRRQFKERGIAGDRLDLRQGPCTADYLGTYGEIDVSLDVFPWTGGVTTCESLWMGVPVLSLCGVRPVARNTAALLSRVGLTDWVTQTPQEYAALAARWENDLDRLARLRAGLRQRVLASLCDAGRFTRVLEDAYRTMWRRWCTQQGQETPNPKPQIPNQSK